MPIVYVEGMDCAGKSAALDLLQKDKGIECRRHRLLSDENPLVGVFRDKKMHYAWNSVEVSNALLDAIEYDLTHFEDDETTTTIQESTLLIKGYAMLVVGGFRDWQIMKRFEQALERHPKFDRSVFLTVDKETRVSRIHQRIERTNWVSENDRLILDDYERFAEIDYVMAAVMVEVFGARIVDTSWLTIEGVAEAIASVLKL